ncbi:MAG: hypothetical protein J4N36_05290 [Chloroflexi bacterium]|nr:hypothetical protein [Chloroflexota bacterium]MCI0813547.1 hypothetical protein [Chloroflexota bacterium]MCI0817526.1 hypothetical protein [Chloroflexota bacterium]MCI0831955.1 hypothetical protein [Chloroflexota bacterium]MCI0843162.1 hypothetical protein [Chloroflexota bacterium]
MPQSPTPTASSSEPETYDAIEVLTFALTAPKEEELLSAEMANRIRELHAEAGRRRHDACRDLVERLAPLAAANEDTIADAAHLCHTEPAALAEDIYALRAFAADPKRAAAVAEMQRYLADAHVPISEPELALDRAIAVGQVSFSVLISDREREASRRRPTKEDAVAEERASYGAFVADPRRMRTAELAFNHFRGVYARRYQEFHAAYWAASSRLHARLLEARRQAEALARLNSLVELGAPLGESAISAHEELIDTTTICEPGAEFANALKTATVCPSCHLRLGAADHAEAVSGVLKTLSQSVERQLSRLSSVAVRAILERSSDPRVGRFLQVVQAAQITTLTEILDDALVGYLRRFLLEARIGTLLEPIFDHVQHGGVNDESATQGALEELADVLHRAIRGAAQAPGDDDETAT